MLAPSCSTAAGKPLYMWQGLCSVADVSHVLLNRSSPEKTGISEMAVDV